MTKKSQHSKSARVKLLAENSLEDKTFVFTDAQKAAMGEIADRLWDVDALLATYAVAAKTEGLTIGAGPAIQRPAFIAIEAVRRRVAPIADLLSESSCPKVLVEATLRELADACRDLSELEVELAVYVDAFDGSHLAGVDATRVIESAQHLISEAWTEFCTIAHAYTRHRESFPQVHFSPELGDAEVH